MTPNLTEAEDTNFNSCMPSSVILEEKLIDENVEFEAPLVPLETPNTKIDDTDPNPILPKDLEPKSEPEAKPKPQNTNGVHLEKTEGIIDFTFDSYNSSMTIAMKGVRDRKKQQALSSL